MEETFRNEFEISNIDIPSKQFIESYCDLDGVVNKSGLEELCNIDSGMAYRTTEDIYAVEFKDTYTVYYAKLERKYIREQCLLDLSDV
jgi:hypothetical protein